MPAPGSACWGRATDARGCPPTPLTFLKKTPGGRRRWVSCKGTAQASPTSGNRGGFLPRSGPGARSCPRRAGRLRERSGPKAGHGGDPAPAHASRDRAAGQTSQNPGVRGPSALHQAPLPELGEPRTPALTPRPHPQSWGSPGVLGATPRDRPPSQSRGQTPGVQSLAPPPLGSIHPIPFLQPGERPQSRGAGSPRHPLPIPLAPPGAESPPPLPRAGDPSPPAGASSPHIPSGGDSPCTSP